MVEKQKTKREGKRQKPTQGCIRPRVPKQNWPTLLLVGPYVIRAKKPTAMTAPKNVGRHFTEQQKTI